MTLQEKILLKERLELILHDWYITDNLEAESRYGKKSISQQQMNQIIKLGLYVSAIYDREYSTTCGLEITFSELNK